jgi:hypothetical protein
MANWATTDDVLAVTGSTVTDAELLQAQLIIEIVADVSPESSFEAGNPDVTTGLISEKNLRYLMMAVAYQAAWMQAHPDVYTNADTKDVSEDGLSFTAGNKDANVLAPLARKCVRRLTWMRPNRSLRLGRRLDPAFMSKFGSRDSAVADDSRDWSPM